MTRDEAIKIWDVGPNYGANIIDTFVELGMLKLDEPKNLEQRTLEALTGAYVGAAIRQPLEKSDIYLIMGWLQNAGLKIVENEKYTVIKVSQDGQHFGRSK